MTAWPGKGCFTPRNTEALLPPFMGNSPALEVSQLPVCTAALTLSTLISPPINCSFPPLHALHIAVRGHKRWVLFPPETPKELIKPKFPGGDREAITWFHLLYPKILSDSWQGPRPLEILQSPGILPLLPTVQVYLCILELDHHGEDGMVGWSASGKEGECRLCQPPPHDLWACLCLCHCLWCANVCVRWGFLHHFCRGFCPKGSHCQRAIIQLQVDTRREQPHTPPYLPPNTCSPYFPPYLPHTSTHPPPPHSTHTPSYLPPIPPPPIPHPIPYLSGMGGGGGIRNPGNEVLHGGSNTQVQRLQMKKMNRVEWNIPTGWPIYVRCKSPYTHSKQHCRRPT